MCVLTKENTGIDFILNECQCPHLFPCLLLSAQEQSWEHLSFEQIINTKGKKLDTFLADVPFPV